MVIVERAGDAARQDDRQEDGERSRRWPMTMTASIRIARKRLPAPAGSSRIGTCSGVVIVTRLMSLRSAAGRDKSSGR